LKNPFQTEIPIFSLISSQDISLDINFYIINHYFQIDLVIAPAFIWKDRFHGTAQRWWILVEVNRFLTIVKHYNCLVFVICLHTHAHTHKGILDKESCQFLNTYVCETPLKKQCSIEKIYIDTLSFSNILELRFNQLHQILAYYNRLIQKVGLFTST
jgi:hypothetical protein